MLRKFIQIFKKFSWNQIIAIFTAIVGFVGAIVGAYIQRSSPEAPTVTRSATVSPREKEDAFSNLQPALQPAKVNLIQFGLNEELCPYYQYTILADSVEELGEFPFAKTPVHGDTALIIREGMSDITGKQGERTSANVRSFTDNPLIDLTFLNSGGADVILTSINVHVVDFNMLQGDSLPRDSTRTVNVTHRYSVLFLVQKRLERMMEIGEKDYLRKFVMKKPAYPPIVIPPNSPARIQVELKTNAEDTCYYMFYLEFVFSNGQKVRKPVVAVF